MKQSLASLPWAFAIEPRLGIGRRGVRVVRALRRRENPSPGFVSPVRGRFVRAILRLEALRRRPGFDQRAVDREVIRAQKPLHTRLRQNQPKNFAAISPSRRRSRFFENTSDPMPPRRRRCPRTSGTEGRTPTAPSTGVPSGSNKTLAAASPATASQAGSTGGQSANTAQKTRPPTPTKLRHDHSDHAQRMVLSDPSSRST